MAKLLSLLSPHLRHYKVQYLSADLTAGLIVAFILIPQSMAYALLAGLPPIVGLYASILPVILYGLLGSTRFLTVGPTAIASIMTISILAPLSQGQPSVYIGQAVILAALVGIVFLICGFLRLGWLVNFINQPVLVGYANAAATIILISQLRPVTGITAPSSSQALEDLISIFRNVGSLKGATVLVGLGSAVFLIGIRVLASRYNIASWLRSLSRLAPLGIVIVSIFLTGVLHLDTRVNLAIVETLPAGSFHLQLPNFDHFDGSLVWGAIAIAAVGLVEGISTAKTMTSATRESVSVNREMVGMGVANTASALSGGFPVTTSISRSSVNFMVGSRTGFSSVITGFVLFMITQYFTDYFYYLPRAVLAAIIISSVINLIDFSHIRSIWQYSPVETLPFFVTFFGVFFFSTQVGILGGIAVAIAIHLFRTSRPHISILGRIDNTDSYADIHYQENARLLPKTILVRVEESIYFANAQFLENFLRQAISDYPNAAYLVLDCRAVNRIDANGLSMLLQMVQEFAKIGVEIYFADLQPHQMSRFSGSHFQEQIRKNHFFRNIHEAVVYLEAKGNESLLV